MKIKDVQVKRKGNPSCILNMNNPHPQLSDADWMFTAIYIYIICSQLCVK